METFGVRIRKPCLDWLVELGVQKFPVLYLGLNVSSRGNQWFPTKFPDEGLEMNSTGVAHCRSCKAVVNLRWATCFACQRPIPPTGAKWLAAWRRLADVVHGITQEDSRFQLVMNALPACDAALEHEDWTGFQHAAEEVARIAKRTNGR